MNAVMCGFVVGTFLSAQPSDADFKSVERAWRERESQTESVHVIWNESRVSFSENSPNKQQKQDAPQIQLFIQGTKIRFQSLSLPRSSGEPADPNTGVLNDSDSRSLISSRSQSRTYGFIYAERRPNFSGQMNVWPVLLLYRGCDEGLIDCPLSVFNGADRTFIPAPDGTLSIKARVSQGRLTQADWTLKVRPDLNYAPTELTCSRNGQPLFDMKVELGRADNGIPVPRSWSLSMLTEQGEIVEAVHATVLQCDLGTRIDDGLFNLEFPEGTIVRDVRPLAAGQPERLYLVANGREREVLHSELARDPTLDELMRTRTGEAGLPQAVSGHRWLIWLNIVVIVVFTLLLAAKLLKRRRAI